MQTYQCLVVMKAGQMFNAGHGSDSLSFNFYVDHFEGGLQVGWCVERRATKTGQSGDINGMRLLCLIDHWLRRLYCDSLSFNLKNKQYKEKTVPFHIQQLLSYHNIRSILYKYIIYSLFFYSANQNHHRQIHNIICTRSVGLMLYLYINNKHI